MFVFFLIIDWTCTVTNISNIYVRKECISSEDHPSLYLLCEEGVYFLRGSPESVFAHLVIHAQFEFTIKFSF